MTFDAAALDARMDTIVVSKQDGAVTVTLSKPERLNALGPDMLDELLDVLAAVRDSRDVKVLVLTGAGRAFCAGVDLETPFFMENVESDSLFEGTRLLDRQHELIAALYELPQPTVAAVNGDAVGGGGFGMAMACDMRFAVSSARFWMIPSRLHVIQDFGLTWLLQRCIGIPRTMELVYSGRHIDGVEAAGLGIVNRAFDRLEDLTAHVDSVVGAITAMGSDAGRMLKLVVRHGATSPLRDQLRVEAIANGLCFNSPEFQSAKSAMLNRMRRR